MLQLLIRDDLTVNQRGIGASQVDDGNRVGRYDQSSVMPTHVLAVQPQATLSTAADQ